MAKRRNNLDNFRRLRKIERKLYSSAMNRVKIPDEYASKLKAAKSSDKIDILLKYDTGRASLMKVSKPSDELREMTRLRNQLVSDNMGLVWSLANRYQNLTHHEHEDLLNIGVIGLIRAVDRFDPDFGSAFSTYAMWWVKHNLTREMSNTGHTVRVPYHKICKGEIAKVSSLDVEIDPLNHITQLDLLEDEGPKLGEVFDSAEDIATINQALLMLKPVHEYVLRKRWGIRLDSATLEAVGEAVGLTRERIRQIELGARDEVEIAIRAINHAKSGSREIH